MGARGILVAGITGALTLANAAIAQTSEIDIPAEDLRVALDAYINQTGVQLVYSVDEVAGKRSHAVHGALSSAPALTQLLRGTGIVASHDASGALVVSSERSEAEENNFNPETVTVTGSRVITSGNDSAPPLTTVLAENLLATTPSDLPDGLNKLPVFIGSRNQRSTGGPTNDWPGNFLNLRDFGVNRTLILLDGMRVPASDMNNEVDVNTLPQALVERVDIVTGGASAVYGSDAVTGAVNFVLDHDFTGFKLSADGGISTYGDDASWKISAVAGTGFSGDRGHAEFSFEHYSSDGIASMMARPLGSAVYMELGSGTAANPYYRARDVRNVTLSPGGYIAAGPLANMTFATNGVLSPFTHGLPGNGPNEIGGDGGYAGEGYFLFPGVASNPWLVASLKSNQFFGRADYSITPSVHAFLQASVSQSATYNVSFVQNISATFAGDNAFLPQQARNLLAAGGAQSFAMTRALDDEQGAISAGYTSNINVIAGAEGTLFDDYTWKAHFTHGVTQLHYKSPYTMNQQHLLAALDAVQDPQTGQTVCRVSLSPQGRALYPGCVPFDAFGPSAESPAAFAYITDAASYKMTNTMDDFGASISGTVFDAPAGPLNAALDLEYRDVSLETDSNFSPTAKVDCTAQNTVTCNPALSVWNGVVANTPRNSEEVAEAAVEADVPIVRDLPLVKSFHLNLAARYTQYSVSGPATTWKLGGVWDVTPEFKLRGTMSRDIRAPTLNNLFAPKNANYTAFTDFLTGVSSTTTVVVHANPDLKPEVARTNTAGFYYTPDRLPGLSLSADWYDIGIHNVITNVNGGNASIEQLCIASGGTAEKYCSLVQRPYPISDTSPDNYPTEVIAEALNNGLLTTHGFDAEANYGFSLDNPWSNAPGSVDTRLLLSYQPSLLATGAIRGAMPTNQAGAAGDNGFSVPAWRVTLDFDYRAGPLSIDMQERWHSGERNNQNPTLVFADTLIPQIFYTDVAFSYRFGSDGHPTAAFLSIENLFNQQPSPYVGIGRTGAEGYAYPASFDQDVIGRYFTAGIRRTF